VETVGKGKQDRSLGAWQGLLVLAIVAMALVASKVVGVAGTLASAVFVACGAMLAVAIRGGRPRGT
jgi:hypothetical protein